MEISKYYLFCLLICSLSNAMDHSQAHLDAQAVQKQELLPVVMVLESLKASQEKKDTLEPEFIYIEISIPGICGIQKVRRRNPAFNFDAKYYFTEPDHYGCSVLKKRSSI